jgi:hypothetical protein
MAHTISLNADPPNADRPNFAFELEFKEKGSEIQKASLVSALYGRDVSDFAPGSGHFLFLPATAGFRGVLP